MSAFCEAVNGIAKAEWLLEQGSALGASVELDSATLCADLLEMGADRNNLMALIASRRAAVAKAQPIDQDTWDGFAGRASW
jgi:hypothetical protein